MDNIELTILMPCLNEEKTIGDCITEAINFIQKNNVNAEILIADNGSQDDSIKIANELGARVVRVKEKGYGNALRMGIMHAKGRYVIMGDCDMSYDFYHLEEFLEKLREGYSLVMGNRFNEYMEKDAMSFSHKYIGVPLLSLMGRIRYKVKVTDFHCGLRGFDRKEAAMLNLKCSGMEFATEIIGKFAESGASIAEVDTHFRKDNRGRKSHLRSIPDGIRHICFMMKNSSTKDSVK